MAKKYCFWFPGTKEDFINILHEYPNNGEQLFCLDDYIVKIENSEYKFGVARGGHSGGYWYLPEISEKGASLYFCGQIKYISPYTAEKGVKKVLNTLDEILLLVFLFPLVPIAKCYSFVASLIRKQKGMPKEITTEDKLFDLMVNYLHCNAIFETDR